MKDKWQYFHLFAYPYVDYYTYHSNRWFYNDDDDGDYDDDEFTGDDYWLDYDNWVDEYCMDVDSDIDEHFLYDEADEFESTCRYDKNIKTLLDSLSHAVYLTINLFAAFLN